MKNKTNIAYWIFTVLLCVLMLFSASMYLFNYDHIQVEFQKLGFPVYLIYPLAIAKIVGVIALLQTKIAVLKEWAYAGFSFVFLFAAISHAAIDGLTLNSFLPIIALGILVLSYINYHKINTITN